MQPLSQRLGADLRRTMPTGAERRLREALAAEPTGQAGAKPGRAANVPIAAPALDRAGGPPRRVQIKIVGQPNRWLRPYVQAGDAEISAMVQKTPVGSERSVLPKPLS